MRNRIVIATILCFILLLSAQTAFAGTINVTSNLDDGTGCTLREAIQQANAGIDGLGCTGVTAAPNTLILPANDYTLTAGSQLSVSSAIIIQSGGGTVNIEANVAANTANYRVFSVTGTGNLTLDGVTVRNGGNQSFAQSGGCIAVAANGDLFVTGSSIIENCDSGSSTGGGGIHGDTGSTISVTSSTIQNNDASTTGAGIWCNGCTLTLTSATISGNELLRTGLSIGGAGIACWTCAASITGTTFSGNTTTNMNGDVLGGALYFQTAGTTATISGSTFTGNAANGSGGSSFGGAVDFNVFGGTLSISGSVFSGNTSTQRGGAISNRNGTVNVTTSRFETNTATSNSDAFYNISGGGITIRQSCITNNGDTSVFDDSSNGGSIDASGGGNVSNSNWWGTSWGPRISAVGGGSAVSNGDSINGNGDTLSGNVLVDVNLTSAGTENSAPTGEWLTTAPTIAGATCQTCTTVSSISHGRTCS